VIKTFPSYKAPANNTSDPNFALLTAFANQAQNICSNFANAVYNFQSNITNAISIPTLVAPAEGTNPPIENYIKNLTNLQNVINLVNSAISSRMGSSSDALCSPALIPMMTNTMQGPIQFSSITNYYKSIAPSSISNCG
jgi:ABC-type transporter lipoprotein component MlaA